MEKVCFSQTDDPKGSGLGKMITTNCLALYRAPEVVN